QKLTEGIRSSEIIPKAKDDLPFNKMLLTDMLRNWQGSFDNEQGGQDKAPKFPLPNNYIFLLRYAHLSGDEAVQAHLALTLQKMAYGGIFDQLGGGFARYSTDRKWKVPHFEKMLYDNAQLVSLYSEAFTATGNPLYKQVVFSTLDFIKREMTSPEGAFYSGLDADSEGEEGRFYTWTKDELGRALGKKLDLFSSYYNVNGNGLWENGRYILLRDKSDEEVAAAAGISVEYLLKEIEEARETLMKVREKRPRPALDDKALTSWNALMLQAYVHAYTAFGEQGFLQSALRNASFILNKQMKSDGGLFHSHRLGRSSINGYLEDYAAVISAFISLYEATLDEQWLHRSENLATYVVQHFYDKNSEMFWFTSEQDSGLVARKMEISDNVIPSSNSIMANNLFLLGMFLDHHDWRDMSDQMLRNMLQQMPSYGPGYSNWGILLMKRVFTFYEIAFSGAHALELQKEFNRHYIPNKLITGSTAPSTLPLLENKFSEDQTRIYVCVNSACKMPVTDVAAALAQIRDL
ncbi:MAG: thioredoxin domain-containing protein, partial [Flavobacteriales bacterium]